MSTDRYPADNGTRILPAGDLQVSAWLNGLPFSLKRLDPQIFSLVESEKDKEVRPCTVNVINSDVQVNKLLGSHRFERFSSFKRLVQAIALLHHIVTSRRSGGLVTKNDYKAVKAFESAEEHILSIV